MDISEKSLQLHEKNKGKIALLPKVSVSTREELSLAYTPGVAAVSMAIAKNGNAVWDYTSRGNWIAVVSDGSAVLGLGNIGPEAALPVMEGKAVLFKEFAGIDAFPLCLNTQNVDEIVATVTAIAPSFAGITLEDISAPRCFEVEERLKKILPIPVMHDDQHGTAVVVLAGLLNAARVAKKNLSDMRIVINGAGAAGTAVAYLLLRAGVEDIVVLDSKGILSRDRTDLNGAKQLLAQKTNQKNNRGTLMDAVKGGDVCIGVSKPGVLTKDMIRAMAADPIIFALANPVPEISPEEARLAGARLIATGRSDAQNQVNNALAFPGIFRGVLDAKVREITDELKLAAAYAIASCVPNPSPERFIPDVFDTNVVQKICEAIKTAK
ncbi:NADP-dependent malic enzyme [Candidatus Uhrbacteria bacterium]|nr:NADP-dependent malic enzyme [Candidatus Uhrbacteria bacterium]